VSREENRPVEALAHSFLSVAGDLVMTSFRQVRDAVELRLFNPDTKPAGATVTFNAGYGTRKSPKAAQAIDFEGNAIGEALELVSGNLTVKLNPKQIASYRVE
jgi:hypothetical protein